MLGVERAKREWELAKEARELVGRDRKYLNGVRGLYALSLVGPELGEVARSSYFFMRYIDDVLDGDRQDESDPLGRVLSLQKQIISGDFDMQDPKSRLAKGALDILEKRKRPDDNPAQDLVNGIDIMLFDHVRAKNRREFTQTELRTYYDKAFSPVVNLMLIGLKSELRADDLPELSLTQGRIYSIRDLSTDWERGIINIPSEVLRSADLSSSSPLDTLGSSHVVNDWIQEELADNKEDLERVREKLGSAPKERVTGMMVKGLLGPMESFVEEYEN